MSFSLFKVKSWLAFIFEKKKSRHIFSPISLWTQFWLARMTHESIICKDLLWSHLKHKRDLESISGWSYRSSTSIPFSDIHIFNRPSCRVRWGCVQRTYGLDKKLKNAFRASYGPFFIVISYWYQLRLGLIIVSYYRPFRPCSESQLDRIWRSLTNGKHHEHLNYKTFKP